jgi:hypothetical protein
LREGKRGNFMKEKGNGSVRKGIDKSGRRKRGREKLSTEGTDVHRERGGFGEGGRKGRSGDRRSWRECALSSDYATKRAAALLRMTSRFGLASMDVRGRAWRGSGG